MTDPKALATLATNRDGYSWIVQECPHCGRRHIHGGGAADGDPREFLGHRVAHCSGPGGYWLTEA